MSTLNESTISSVLATKPVFLLNTILTFFKQFSPFINVFSLKHASPYTSRILQEILHGLQFSATKNFMTDLYSYLEHYLICPHFEKPQNKYFSKIKIIFAINLFQTMQNLYLWKIIKNFFFLNYFPF